MDGQEWCYWDVGLERSWTIVDRLALTVRVFGELGDARHFRAQYGANPNAAAKRSAAAQSISQHADSSTPASSPA